MGEFELIRRYFAAAPCAQAAEGVVLGIGDDCALLQPAVGQQLAVSTDTLVAGVHFPQPCDPFLLGQRALAVSVSDLAAMGAEPLGFTLALTLPEADPAWLEGFARGLSQMAGQCAIALVGGDTTRGPLSLTLSVFGQLPAGQANVPFSSRLTQTHRPVPSKCSSLTRFLSLFVKTKSAPCRGSSFIFSAASAYSPPKPLRMSAGSTAR